MGDLGGEELEEAVELVRIAAERGGQRRGVGVLRGLDRAHLHLQLAAEALDAAEDLHRVALAEALVEQSTSFQTRASTRPLASASSSARYGAPARVRRAPSS